MRTTPPKFKRGDVVKLIDSNLVRCGDIGTIEVIPRGPNYPDWAPSEPLEPEYLVRFDDKPRAHRGRFIERSLALVNR
jgi:hypothetical protein